MAAFDCSTAGRVRRLVDEPVTLRPVIPRQPVVLSVAVLLVLWLSSTFSPGPTGTGMTMQWGDRCPHSMKDTDRHCPECERRGEPMPGCPEAGAEGEHALVGMH